ncbi:dual oxidase-like isoform X2 [Centruroides vittatus]|uniref:dual oxidase-like isoform X2 n=1 Tax=Centruroides vittatus TaxID=120091 RepID=UPI0035107140
MTGGTTTWPIPTGELQMNLVTSWIDGSFVYSTSEAWVDHMRSFRNGTLRTDSSSLFPARNKDRVPLINYPTSRYLGMLNPERMFVLGDPRTNQNPSLLAFAVLFFRWHNVLARRFQRQNPRWSDEEVFQKSRSWVVATLQNIIMYEYLPMLLGEEMEAYSGYNPDIHPGVNHVFQSAAFRFGHTMIPPGIYRRDKACNFKSTANGYPAVRLCATWWNSEEVLLESGIEELIMGLASQIAEREDNVLCDDVRDQLFGPMEFSRRDLAALNIMRGRDNGLPDYNTVRSSFHLPRITNWSDINPQLFSKKPEMVKILKDKYGESPDDLDLYVGGMLETEADGRPGILFRTIIKEQFRRLRDSDRFWFENSGNGFFTKEEIKRIKKTTIYDVVIESTSIGTGHVQKNMFSWKEGDPCPQKVQLNGSMLEPCSAIEGYDYFHGNEVAYIYSCLALTFVPIICAGLGYGVIKLQNKRRRKIKLKRDEAGKTCDKLQVKEWLHRNYKRYVKVKLGPDDSVSTVDRKGEILRRIGLASVGSVVVEVSKDARKKPTVLIRSPADHDLVLQFDKAQTRRKFLDKLENFLTDRKKTLELIPTNRETMLKNSETKEKRQSRLERFFREAYALTFGIKSEDTTDFDGLDEDAAAGMTTSLSKREFAEALGMRHDSLFVRRMFNCVDKNKDGRISFREFLDTVASFSRGKTEDKLRIIFDMCDNDGVGVVGRDELSKMLRSLVDMAKTSSLTERPVTDAIDCVFAAAGLRDKEELSYEDFSNIMKEHTAHLVDIGLDFKGAKQNFLTTTRNLDRTTSFRVTRSPEPKYGWLRRKWNDLATFLEEYRQHLFYLFLFYVVTLVLFLERFAHYTYLAEHTDLRHVMGVGIAFTRGSAAALSFCYSLLPLTMSRNLITKLRELAIHQYVPLDSHVRAHKIIAVTGFVFTVAHTVGHCINFYHVSTQPLEHLKCLTKEMHFHSDFKPTIAFWLFQTITGITGILLFAIVCIMFVFSHPYIRQKAYSYFWSTHSLYVIFFVLCLIHGLARITGSPRFWMFVIGPAIIFTIDKIVSLYTKYMELDILETELLPSDVTRLKFARPPNFRYLSGQWVRLCCTSFSPNEYHSLTLTSAPHENYLSVHVKAQGPWTWKLRNYLDPSNLNDAPLPKLRLEGPYGGGNQDWYKFEVAIMIGGGIGVTPYASILNDLVFGTSTNKYSGVACKKVYFLWICPSHRHFEWFIDALRDVERRDVTGVLEIHIFITQFFHKFDLRTTMLYICENHFQRISNRSMFTGLKAINHFGRPDMTSFLNFVQQRHLYVSKIGVFSCGPSSLTKSISRACETVNKRRKLPYFIHHYENF